MSSFKYISISDSLRRKFSKDENELLDFINDKIAAGATLHDIITFLFHNVQKVIPSDRIGVAFIEEKGERMVLYDVVANYQDLSLAAGYSAELEGSSLQRIFTSDVPRIINDLKEYGDEHPDSESTHLLLKEGILSSMTCLLKVEDRNVGLLFFSSRLKNVYDEKQIVFHLAISERLSQAVEKAYLIEQLRESINSYLEMLGFVTHELRSPLHSIIMVGNTLLGGYFGTIQDKQREMIRQIVDKAEYLNRTVDDYLNLSRFDDKNIQLNIKKINIVTDVIQPVLEIIEPQTINAKVVIKKTITPDLSPVQGDLELIKIVMMNLVSNAVKYGNEGGNIEVKAEKIGDAIRVSVWNEGPGFPLNEKKKLFRKFSRIQTPELLKAKGSGVGLYTSWKIIRLHHGTIKADSELGRWAEFSFSIPLHVP